MSKTNTTEAKEIRWKQRFQNFEKSFLALSKALQIKNPSETERAGLMQFFEMTFELAWKTLKDYLEAQGFQVTSPRDTLKQAFQSELIQNGHAWMEALDDRNLTAHTYDEATSIKVDQLIREKYAPLLKELYQDLKAKNNASKT